MFSVLLWLLLQSNPSFQIPWQTIRDFLEVNPADTVLAVEPTKDPIILDQANFPESTLVDSIFHFSAELLRHVKAKGIVKDTFLLAEAEKHAGKIPGDTLFANANLRVNGKNGTVFIVCPTRKGNLPIVRAQYDKSLELIRLEYVTQQGCVTGVASLK